MLAFSPLVILGRVFLGWRSIPSGIRGAMLVALAGFVGVVWGEHDGKRRCNARIDASIATALALDAKVSAEQTAIADRQKAEAGAREVAMRDEVRRYTDELATKVASECRAGADAARFNDGLGVSDPPVQPAPKKPASIRHGGARPIPVPARKPE